MKMLQTARTAAMQKLHCDVTRSAGCLLWAVCNHLLGHPAQSSECRLSDPFLSQDGDIPLFGFVFSEMPEVIRSPAGQTLLTSLGVINIIAYLGSERE